MNQSSRPDGSPSGSRTNQTPGSGIAEDVKQQADAITEQAKSMARDAAQSGQSLAAEQLSGFADGVRRSAESWDDTQHAWVKQALTGAADGIERFSSTLKERDLPSLLSEAENAARRNPALFAAGCAVLGFALVRFLKSSSHGTSYAGSASTSRRRYQASPQPDGLATSGRYSDSPQNDGYTSAI